MPGERRLYVRALVRGVGRDAPRLDVELELRAGVTAVMGSSGAGKSTLLASIAGLVRPSDGLIVLDDQTFFDSTRSIDVPTHERRIGLVFQSLALFPHLSVWQNVAYGLPAPARASQRARAMHWLARMHVQHLADRRPATLSGGEAQRVALARTFASEPRALLLDEPFSALDPQLRAELGAELHTLISELDIPTVLVTHELRDAIKLGSRIIQLDQGRERYPSHPRQRLPNLMTTAAQLRPSNALGRSTRTPALRRATPQRSRTCSFDRDLAELEPPSPDPATSIRGGRT